MFPRKWRAARGSLALCASVTNFAVSPADHLECSVSGYGTNGIPWLPCWTMIRRFLAGQLACQTYGGRLSSILMASQQCFGRL